MNNQERNLEFHQAIEIWKEYSQSFNPDEIAINLNLPITEVFRVINGEKYPESKELIFQNLKSRSYAELMQERA